MTHISVVRINDRAGKGKQRNWMLVEEHGLVTLLEQHGPDSIALATALQLGQLLKAERKRRKITQAQVAARLGLSQNRVSHLERHAEEISFKQLLVWCAVLGLELRLGGRESPNSTSEW